MGLITNYTGFTDEKKRLTRKPIIYCFNDRANDYDSISLNLPLTKKLFKLYPKISVISIGSIFREVISELPKNPTIKEFDVLLNP